MKKESPLWSSISLLIGIVIAILALIRGRMLLPLLLAVFALWLLWWLLTQALPLWRNNRAYRAKEARLREQTAAANGGGQLADALLCHVNYRITAMLHAALLPSMDLNFLTINSYLLSVDTVCRTALTGFWHLGSLFSNAIRRNCSTSSTICKQKSSNFET